MKYILLLFIISFTFCNIDTKKDCLNVQDEKSNMTYNHSSFNETITVRVLFEKMKRVFFSEVKDENVKYIRVKNENLIEEVINSGFVNNENHFKIVDNPYFAEVHCKKICEDKFAFLFYSNRSTEKIYPLNGFYLFDRKTKNLLFFNCCKLEENICFVNSKDISSVCLMKNLVETNKVLVFKGSYPEFLLRSFNDKIILSTITSQVIKLQSKNETIKIDEIDIDSIQELFNKIIFSNPIKACSIPEIYYNPLIW